MPDSFGPFDVVEVVTDTGPGVQKGTVGTILDLPRIGWYRVDASVGVANSVVFDAQAEHLRLLSRYD